MNCRRWVLCKEDGPPLSVDQLLRGPQQPRVLHPVPHICCAGLLSCLCCKSSSLFSENGFRFLQKKSLIRFFATVARSLEICPPIMVPDVSDASSAVVPAPIQSQRITVLSDCESKGIETVQYVCTEFFAILTPGPMV